MLSKQIIIITAIGLLIAFLNIEFSSAEEYVAKSRKCKRLFETINSEVVTTHKRPSAMAMSADGMKCDVKLMVAAIKEGETVASLAIKGCQRNDTSGTCKVVVCLRCEK